MKLYAYWRSSSFYGVRIALTLQGIARERIPANLAVCAPSASDLVADRLEAMGHREEEIVSWMKDWMMRGLDAFAAARPDVHPTPPDRRP